MNDCFLSNLFGWLKLRVRKRLYVLCALAFAITSFDVHAAEGARAKRVLIVSTESSLASGFTLAEQTAVDHGQTSKNLPHQSQV